MSDETPEDVATLYSWANLRGAKYRDFSATRARVRELARQRVQQAMESERKRAQEADAPAVPATPPVIANETPVPAEAQTPLEIAAMQAREPAVDAASDVPANTTRRADVVSQSSATPFASAAPMARSSQTPQWYALKSFFPDGLGRGGAEQAVQASGAGRVPAVAVFSLAGGVGKSSLVATLGRTLSARGERVLLVDTAAFGTLPFFFGAQDQRMGVLRTFRAPREDNSTPIEVLALDPDGMEQQSHAGEPLTQEILRNARGVNRVLIDLSTASGATVRRVLRLSPTVLIPVTPDVRSVASVGAIEAFFQRNPSGTGQTISPTYVLNGFDEGARLHQDVRDVLRNQLCDRLLPFVLHRSSSVSEALAEGMTVVDYAPGSLVTRDYETLAEWIRVQAAPMNSVYRVARWSER